MILWATVPTTIMHRTSTGTVATHLIRKNVNLVVLRDLLGHRQLSSTIYVHMTAEDIRKAIDRHPIQKLVHQIRILIPNIKLPFQYLPGQRFAFNS